MNISVEYEPTVDELLRGLRRARRGPRRVIWAVAIVALVTGLAIVAVGFSAPHSRDAGLIEVGTADAAVGLLYVFALTYGTRRGVARLAGRMCRPTRVTLTDEHVGMSTDLVTTQAAWEAYLTVRQAGGFLLLFPTKRQIHVVPLRAFTPEQVAELTAFLAGRGAVKTPRPAVG